MHSATKYLNGHGDAVGGLVCCSNGAGQGDAVGGDRALRRRHVAVQRLADRARRSPRCRSGCGRIRRRRWRWRPRSRRIRRWSGCSIPASPRIRSTRSGDGGRCAISRGWLTFRLKEASAAGWRRRGRAHGAGPEASSITRCRSAITARWSAGCPPRRCWKARSASTRRRRRPIAPYAGDGLFRAVDRSRRRRGSDPRLRDGAVSRAGSGQPGCFGGAVHAPLFSAFVRRDARRRPARRDAENAHRIVRVGRETGGFRIQQRVLRARLGCSQCRCSARSFIFRRVLNGADARSRSRAAPFEQSGENRQAWRSSPCIAAGAGFASARQAGCLPDSLEF